MNKQIIIQLVENKEYDKAKKLIIEDLIDSKDDIELHKLLGLCNINLSCMDEAYENFSFLVEKNSEDALSLYYLATINIEKNNLPEAERLLKKVIELRENYIDAYKSLAVVYIKQNKYNEVLLLQNKMLEIASDDIQVYEILSSASMGINLFDLTIDLVLKALEIFPNEPKFLNRLGLAYFSTGKIIDAIEMYNKALEFAPDELSIVYNLGLAYFASENFKQAMVFLKKACEMNSEQQYLSSYAFAALKANKLEEAESAYEKLAGQYPEKENFQYNLACVYDGLNKLDKAAQIIERLLTFNLNSIPLKLHLASLYSRRNMIEAAQILYADIMNSGFVNNDIMYEYAVLCARGQNTDKAEELLKQIIAIDPSFAYAYKDLGVIYLSRKFFDKSLEYFKKAYKLAPDDIYVLFEYGNYFHLLSDFENAKKMYSKLLKQEENIPVYMLNSIAVNYISLNMIKKAKDILLESIKKEPQNIDTLFHLAQIYFSENNFENSRQLLEDAYNIEPNLEIANLLAKVYMELEEYNKAFTLFSVVRMSVPANISVIMSLAECKYKQKDYDEARKYINDILEIFPENEEACELLNKINEGVK